MMLSLIPCIFNGTIHGRDSISLCRINSDIAIQVRFQVPSKRKQCPGRSGPNHWRDLI